MRLARTGECLGHCSYSLLHDGIKHVACTTPDTSAGARLPAARRSVHSMHSVERSAHSARSAPQEPAPRVSCSGSCSCCNWRSHVPGLCLASHSSLEHLFIRETCLKLAHCHQDGLAWQLPAKHACAIRGTGAVHACQNPLCAALLANHRYIRSVHRGKPSKAVLAPHLDELLLVRQPRRLRSSA
jgi:hypothetical protein